jgi:DNA polymerase
MNKSELGKLVKATKNYIEDEKLWCGSEIPCENVVRVQSQSAHTQKTANTDTDLEDLKKEASKCQKCQLGKSRINVVFGVGNPKAQLMFIGEGPGFDEDHKGEPFIGRAGMLLTKIIEAMKLTREDVYIANIVKCHPMIDPTNPERRGNDRPPTPQEVQSCMPYLEKQVEIINPKVICTLGSSATKALLAVETPISKLRGKFFEYKSVPLMPTYHPAALLRNPSLKKDVWQDMKAVLEKIK